MVCVTNSLFSVIVAIYITRFRAAFGLKRVSSGSDIVHAELPSAACRVDLVSARGLKLSLLHISLLRVVCSIYISNGYALLRGAFGQTRVIPRKRPSAH